MASLLAVLLVGMSACSHTSGEDTSTKNESKADNTSQSTDDSSQSKGSSTDSTVKSDNSGEKNDDEQTSNSSDKVAKDTIANTASKNSDPKEIFYGQWQIQQAIAFGPAGTYSSDELKTLEGKPLTFSKKRATCFGDQMDSLNHTITNPVYKRTVRSKKDFESGYRVTFDKLGIKEDSITEVDATGTKGICNVFFITQDNNKLILYGGGVFFELDRFSNQNQSTGDKEVRETLSQYSSEQIEYARVWLQLGPNQDLAHLNVRHIPAGTPLNPDDDTNVGYPEDVIQLSGSRIVDGIVTYSSNGDGTINVYNVPYRWYGGFSRPDNVSVEEIREEMKRIINNTKLVYVAPGDADKIIKLIKLLDVHK